MKKLNVDKTTCWYESQYIMQVGKLLKKEGMLNSTEHDMILEKLISFILETEEKFLDIGCGGATACKIVGKREYTSVDLLEIIEKVLY